MSTIKNMVQLGQLIASQHGWAAAKAAKFYELSEADQLAVSNCAINLLKKFPSGEGSGVLISAALAVSLEHHLQAPINVVAGTLTVEGAPVPGDRRPFDGFLFGMSHPNWEGYAWVMIGPYVVDISIFRIAYSPEGPARVAKHVDLTFGPQKALYVDHWKRTRKMGLSYEPHYVLSAEEVTSLMGTAFHLIKQAQLGSSA